MKLFSLHKLFIDFEKDFLQPRWRNPSEIHLNNLRHWYSYLWSPTWMDDYRHNQSIILSNSDEYIFVFINHLIFCQRRML